MIKPTLHSILIFVVLAVVFAACKKTSILSTPYTKVVGTWKLTKTGTDDNNDGKIDNNELQPVDTNDVETIKFNDDFTGVQHIVFDTVATDYPFAWTLTDDYNTLLRIVSGGDTIKSAIADINSSSLLLITNTTPVATFYLYQK